MKISKKAFGKNKRGHIPRTQPEQNDGVELVGVGNGQSRQHKEKNDVTQDEIGSEVTQLGNLAQEFTARLGEGVPTHVVPFTSPPSDVGLIVLELTGKGERNNQLVDEALDGHGGDHARDSSRPAEGLQDEQNLEEDKQNDDSNSVGDSR